MRVLFSIHLYPPKHCAGGEMYVHNLAKHLVSRGHICRILLHQAKDHNITRMYNYEGVDVFPKMRNIEEHFIWADRVFTHLDYTAWTIQMCKIFRKPCYFIVHNTHVYQCAMDDTNPVNILYNTQYARDLLNYPKPGIVLHPPVDYRDFDVCKEPEKNKYITLVSLNKNKGGEIFYEIAKRLPDKQFLGVRGGYHEQIMHELPNVTIVEHTSNMLDIYRQTRIVLMPSEYESYGMVCAEAMCSGIPVISTPTFGLKENAGPAGIFVDPREDIDQWVKEIKKLDSKKNYLSASNKCRERSRQIDPLKEYELLRSFAGL